MWEWTHTLPSGLPLWELESWWILKSLKGDYRGQNSLDWNVFYTIGKFLRHGCLKCFYMIHLNTQNVSYGQKKGWESNCQFHSQPLKVGNRFDFLARKWRAAYHGKLSTRLQLVHNTLKEGWQGCNSHRELSNGMWHATCTQGNQSDSQF